MENSEWQWLLGLRRLCNNSSRFKKQRLELNDSNKFTFNSNGVNIAGGVRWFIIPDNNVIEGRHRGRFAEMTDQNLKTFFFSLLGVNLSGIERQS